MDADLMVGKKRLRIHGLVDDTGIYSITIKKKDL